MASSRLFRIGSIFQRLTGIIKAGAIKQQDIPLWYEIYKAFPPKYEPTFARPAVEKEIQPIYYPEDVIRGKFKQLYGSPSVHDLLRPSQHQSVMQRFVEIYSELERSERYFSEEDLIKATESTLEEEGISFIRSKKIVNTPSENKENITHEFPNEKLTG